MNAWRPSSDTAAAQRRAAMLGRARAYFAAEGVLEVTTPVLSRYAGSDPNIDSFEVRSRLGERYFLHTSPEFCMKRLLAAGYPDIYAIGPVFRDGESGKRHAPEFTLIEWYRLGYELDEIVADTTGLLANCLGTPKLAETAQHVEYADAFRTIAGVDVFAAAVDDLARCVAADERMRHEMGDDRDSWLDLIMSTVIAPQLPAGRLTVIRHYPASQAALARSCPGDARVADRFEVFCGALELANGYVELTDVAEQRRRIDEDLEKRRRLGRDTYPWDRAFIDALDSGLPDCAGVAVGLERLQMVADNTDDIRNVMSFAFGNADESP